MAFSVSNNEMPRWWVLLCRCDEASVIVGVGALGDIGDAQTTARCMVGREVILMADAVVNVEEIQLPRILLRMLIDGQGSGASLTMFEMEVAPGGAMPIPHHHVGFDETAYCMAGRLRMMRDGKTVDVEAGGTVHIPRGMVHAFENPFEETAKVLVVITPGVFGAPYFRDVRELMAGGGPPDLKRAAEVMMRHGLVPVVAAPR